MIIHRMNCKVKPFESQELSTLLNREGTWKVVEDAPRAGTCAWLEQPGLGHPRPHAVRLDYQQPLRRVQGSRGVAHSDVNDGFLDAEIQPVPGPHSRSLVARPSRIAEHLPLRDYDSEVFGHIETKREIERG